MARLGLYGFWIMDNVELVGRRCHDEKNLRRVLDGGIAKAVRLARIEGEGIAGAQFKHVVVDANRHLALDDQGKSFVGRQRIQLRAGRAARR